MAEDWDHSPGWVRREDEIDPLDDRWVPPTRRSEPERTPAPYEVDHRYELYGTGSVPSPEPGPAVDRYPTRPNHHVLDDLYGSPTPGYGAPSSSSWTADSDRTVPTTPVPSPYDHLPPRDEGPGHDNRSHELPEPGSASYRSTFSEDLAPRPGEDRPYSATYDEARYPAHEDDTPVRSRGRAEDATSTGELLRRAQVVQPLVDEPSRVEVPDPRERPRQNDVQDAPTRRSAQAARSSRAAAEGEAAPSRSATGKAKEKKIKGRHRPWYIPTDKLPVGPLWLMAAAGFITYLTETMPVGVMKQMTADPALGMSEATVGQLVSIYAIGCGVAAIPTTLLTRHLPRKNLLLWVLGAFAVCNAGTALMSDFLAMAVFRAAAGACAGLLWAMLAGYALRIVKPGIAGKAMAIAMAGTPMALSFGTPLGAFLGDLMGWRLAFFAASGLALAAAGLGVLMLPMVPGEIAPKGSRRSTGQVLALPGMIVVVLVTAVFSIGHNAVYTFIVPVMADAGATQKPSVLLLAFGLAAAVGLFVIGKLVDSRLRTLTLAVGALLAVSCVAVWATRFMPEAALAPMVLWGLAFGGAPTLFQTASARICGDSQEVGQAIIVTTFNCAAAAAAAIGGVYVESGAPDAIPWTGLMCAGLALTLVVQSAKAFPAATVASAAADEDPGVLGEAWDDEDDESWAEEESVAVAVADGAPQDETGPRASVTELARYKANRRTDAFRVLDRADAEPARARSASGETRRRNR